ncbi:MAG: hypothetical protein V8S69_01580 [Dakarella massiliensis]
MKMKKILLAMSLGAMASVPAAASAADLTAAPDAEIRAIHHRRPYGAKR